MGRPPKKSCNACCSPGSPDTPDPPSSPTSCDDMINILILSGTKQYVRNKTGGNTWEFIRSQQETDDEYLHYRAAYPNRVHIFLEFDPTYLPGYLPDVPRASIRYPSGYGDSDFDLSFWEKHGVFADRHPTDLGMWSLIVGMVNGSSTEVQNSFNNASQVCIDHLSDRYLRNGLLQPATAVGMVYKNLVNDAQAAGKNIVAPVGYTSNSFTNPNLKRVQTLFAGFAHHECCNSAAADEFRKFTTAIPDCFPTMNEEPDSEYRLELSDIKPDGNKFSLFQSACILDSNNRFLHNIKLAPKLFKGDQRIFDRVVSCVLQKKDLKTTKRQHLEPNPLGDERRDANGNVLDSFSDLFPLTVDYADKSSFRPINIEDTHQHSRIPLKYAKTFKVSDGGLSQHELLRDIDLISITHPGDLGTQRFRNLPLLKDYPNNGDAKLFRRAHAPDWFRTYNIPVEFMAVNKGSLKTRVYVKRPVIDFDNLSSQQFLYGGEGQPLCGTMEGTYTVGGNQDARNLSHFLLRTANEKDGENNLHLGNKYSEEWLQNEWVQIGDALSTGSSASEGNVKLACHRYSLNDPDGTFTSLYLAKNLDRHKITIYLYDPDGSSDVRDENGGHIGRWNSVGNINLQTILEDLPPDHRPVAGKASNWHAKPLLYQCRILDFKVKHVNNEENTFENDKYLLVGDTFHQHIYVLKESNNSGNFELLFYTMGHDASMNAACDKLVVSACNNSTTTGPSASFNPPRTANLSPQRSSASWDINRLYTLPDGTHNSWFNTSVFSIPDSPAANAFVEPDVVFSEANGYLLELASCQTVNMEAAGNAFVFTPSRRFRNGNSDLIMGMCQYIHPSLRYGSRSFETEKRRGSKTLGQTYVHAAGQFKTGWNCRKSDLIYAKDIPSRGIRSNFLNSPTNFFFASYHPPHYDNWDKPQIVLSHPVDIANENSMNATQGSSRYLLNPSHNIDYMDPPGYEVAIPFFRYPNVLYKSEYEAPLDGSDYAVVMNERIPNPKESTNDRGMISNRGTDKSYITDRNEAFHRLSRPGKVFLFKYTNYHGWSYRKMIPDRNGTFPNQTDVVDARQSSYLPPGLDRLTGHNVTGKPGLDSGALGETFVQDDRVFDTTVGSSPGGWVSPFGATGPHTQHGDYGDAGKFCRFVNTIDPAVNPRDVNKTYYIRDYKTMVFSDRSKNYPDAKQSDGSYKYLSRAEHTDIHTFFIKSGLESKPHRRGVQYIPFYQNHGFATTPDLLDLDIVPADNCQRSPYIPFPFNTREFRTTLDGSNVSQLGFSYLFQSPFLTTAAGESMGLANPVFQGLDSPGLYLGFNDEAFGTERLRQTHFKPSNRLSPFSPYFQFSRSRIMRTSTRNVASQRRIDQDHCDLYILPRRQFRIKVVHIRDDGTEDVAFSEVFYMNVFNRRRDFYFVSSVVMP